jgi:hypothetical protein
MGFAYNDIIYWFILFSIIYDLSLIIIYYRLSLDAWKECELRNEDGENGYT